MGRDGLAAATDDFVGREILQDDVVADGPVRGLIATLQSRAVAPQPGDPAPLLAHWLYCLPYTPLADAGPDGHPRRGATTPPDAPPRRMWAGSEIAFHRPLRIGATIRRRSTVAELAEKQGRSGRLLFVTIDHALSDGDGPVLNDRQQIVYRDLPPPDARPQPPEPAPAAPQWQRRIDPDPVLLFRYSALTFNSHRIHYDRSYATGVEGYPGLVVHGPLVATLMLHELVARHPTSDVASYSFRAVRPIFDTSPFHIGGSLGDDGAAHLFAADDSGALCFTATARLRR